SWVKGAFHFSALTGNNVRLPDIRDQFVRATGTDADTANARALGSAQSTRSNRLDRVLNNSGSASFEHIDVPESGTSDYIFTGGTATTGQSSRSFAFRNTGGEARGPNTAF